MRFARKEMSESDILIPMDAASRGDLPVRYFLGSYPITERFAESLPGLMPSGTVAALPISPLDAKLSIQGISAASSGVFPPRLSMGLSAEPSGTTMRYFIYLFSSSNFFMKLMRASTPSFGIAL